MPLGKRQNPRPRPPLVSARFSVLFCAAHVPLSRQQRLCFTLAQPQGLRTATPFHLSRILGSLPAELTPNRIPSISSWKPLLTLLTGSDHPIRSERRGASLCTMCLSLMHIPLKLFKFICGSGLKSIFPPATHSTVSSVKAGPLPVLLTRCAGCILDT